MKNKQGKLGLLWISLLFVSSILIVLFLAPIDNNSFVKEGELFISEVMWDNTYTIMDEDNEFSDYIEIYNGYDEDINLEGYYLSDSNKHYKWEFPRVIVKAHDYLLVFASDKNRYGEYLHTNFKLDKSGEVVTLTSPDKVVLSQVTYNKSKNDTSYGYYDENYVYFKKPTPGYENSNYISELPIKEISGDIIINEYNDKKVELYNTSNNDINLDGYRLSVLQSDYEGIVLEDKTIKSHDYIVIDIQILENSDNIILYNSSLDEVDKVKYEELPRGVSKGRKDKKEVYYLDNTFGKENSDKYYLSLSEIYSNEKLLVINEVSADKNSVEIKNVSNEVINLANYMISDNKASYSLKGTINPNDYYVVKGMKINNNDEVITLTNLAGNIIDKFNGGKISPNGSKGLNSDGKVVIFSTDTIGRENSNNYYLGYSKEVIFSIQGGYVKEGTSISLKTIDDSEIYYTTDGSFPTSRSKKYTEPIKIDKTMVIKAIAIKDGYMASEMVSRTFIVGRNHDIAYVSISSDNNTLFGSNGLISNPYDYGLKKISFEFYENDGSFGTSFIGEAKLSGNFGGSRDKAQKGMSIYLRTKYGNNTMSYPLFDEVQEYSSFLLRNGGEDYLNIHIFDAALQVALKDQMDIDMQDYRPVVVYINGSYYGIYNLRDKLNGDYVENKFDVSKDDMTVIKYSTPTQGSINEWNNLMNYVKSHDVRNKEVWEYLKTQIDMQELCNYWIVQSYYANTDVGNVKYWKSKNGKWRLMLYDIDWSLYFTNSSMTYPVIYGNIPAVTYVYDTIDLTRRLYQNSEFKEMYLTSLAYHLENTFKPERMNKIVDELALEIEKEMPYHMDRWKGTNSSLGGSVSTWKNNISLFKSKISSRYNYVVNNLYSFGLSQEEYNKYFGNLR